VNHHVQNGFLTSSNPLKHLFRERPDTAIEVLLALLIKEPLPVNPYGEGRRFGGYDFSLDSGLDRDWRPGIFFHGPFLDFLRISPKKGIEAIVSMGRRKLSLRFIDDYGRFFPDRTNDFADRIKPQAGRG
jgi:hypothetical protein